MNIFDAIFFSTAHESQEKGIIFLGVVDPDKIGSVNSKFVDSNLYSKYGSGSTQLKNKKKTRLTDKNLPS